MKLSCTRDNLHQALSIASHLTSKNVNLPVLQNVLVKAEGGTIRFTTTNLELAVHCAVRGKVDESGSCTVPSKLFSDYVSLLPNEHVAIVSEGDTLRVSCGSHKTKINGLPAVEFPVVPSVEDGVTLQIPVEGLRRALSQVLMAVATNESRPELTGVSMRVSGENGGGLTLAATDSYRLSERILSLDGGESVGEHRIIVPSRTLSELNRILSVFKDSVESPSVVTMTFSESQVTFHFGSVELISRLIEGTYPDYQQIIPKNFQTKAIVDRDDLIKAVKAASLFSRQGLFDVTLVLNPETNTLSVKALEATTGENIVECGAEVTGQQNTVTVNYRYLLDGLNAMGTEKIVFEMIDAANPCLLTPKETEESAKNEYLYIVMPIRQ